MRPDPPSAKVVERTASFLDLGAVIALSFFQRAFRDRGLLVFTAGVVETLVPGLPPLPIVMVAPVGRICTVTVGSRTPASAAALRQRVM
jgi:hypothetical protein